MGDGVVQEPNLLWWQRAGSAWLAEVARRKRYRLPYHIEEVFLAEYLARQAPARVLEFGCGFGRHLRYLRQIEGLEMYGFDQSEKLVAEMGAWAPSDWLAERVRVGRPLEPLPYPDGHFDVVFTVSVLIHNRPEHVEGLLRELVRVCRGHVLLVENPLVPETSFFSSEHDGCWQHALEAHLAAIGHACERLPRFTREHDVYRVRVRADARVVDLHSVTLENLRRMQEELTGQFETPEAVLGARLAEMTADRDRLREETQSWARSYEESRQALEAAHRRVQEMTADCDRLRARVAAAEAEAVARAGETQWLRRELDRVNASRSVRFVRWLAGSLPARLARHTLRVAKDHASSAVRVRATGTRNPASAGSEVWVLDDARAVPSHRDGHWAPADRASGEPAWRADGEGTLVLPASTARQLRLLAHPRGGIAEVRWRGRVRRVDLYRDAPGVMEIDLSDGRCTAVASPPARCTAVPETAMVVVARLREAGQTHVAIAPPDWLGIRASMRVMFGEVVSVPELYDAAMVDVWVEALLASGARKIVLGGFARGYERLVRRLRARDPGVHVYATWHGNAAQHNEEYARWGFNTLHALAEEGAIACVGHTKVGLDRSLRHARYPIRTLLNWYPLAPAFAARPLNDGAVHLGLFTAGSGWRKNVHTQIAAAALIECHALHLRVTYPDELEWARIVNTRVVEVFERALPQEELHRRLQEMHCNFYVTYAENVPMFPFESLGHGVLAVIGTGGYVFRDHAYLRERLIVPHPDDPVVIAAHVERALAERDAVLRAYREFCREYIPQAERAVREFLAVE